jgi:hypothetical protein
MRTCIIGGCFFIAVFKIKLILRLIYCKEKADRKFWHIEKAFYFAVFCLRLFAVPQYLVE